MPTKIHGAQPTRRHHHPLLDIKHWSEPSLLAGNSWDGAWIDGPVDLAAREKAIRKAQSKGDPGPFVPSDVFVWADTLVTEKPWLTRIGGRPWREKKKPWPKDRRGVPLHFLGQICFTDSMDILPCKLPGDVALIFGRWEDCCVSTYEDSALEWSPIKLREPLDWSPGWSMTLPFCRQGVIHRTIQYSSWQTAESTFKAAGFEDGGWGIHSIQATSIGAYACLPQGWPFDTKTGGTLIASLSSSYLRDHWPLCDLERSLVEIDAKGRASDELFQQTLDFGIGDAGAIWIYRDKKGKFHLDEACG